MIAFINCVFLALYFPVWGQGYVDLFGSCLLRWAGISCNSIASDLGKPPAEQLSGNGKLLLSGDNSVDVMHQHAVDFKCRHTYFL